MKRQRGLAAGATAVVTALGALGAMALVSAANTRSPQPQAAEPSPPVIRSSAEVVELEVLVSDHNGDPVAGLRAEDFEIRDDGRPRVLSHFAYRRVSLLQTEGQSGEDSAQLDPRPPVLGTGESRRVIAFVVDTLHMSIESVLRARRMLEEFIDKEMARGDLVLIMPTNGGSGILQQFMTDRRMLRRAVARLLPFDQMGEDCLRATFDGIDNVVRAMASLPGRRLVILVSEGFPRIAADAFRTDIGLDLSETAARTAGSNVVLYAINPLGLEGPIAPATEESAASQDGRGLPTGANLRQARRSERDEGLVALAEPTGGRAFLTSNDMSAALRRTLRENAEYYVLGFEPERREWDGKYHRLKVSVRGRSDVVASTRRGYLAQAPRADAPLATRAADTKTARIAEAIASPLSRRDIDVVLTPLVSDDERQQPRLVTMLHVDAAPLVFKEVERESRVPEAGGTGMSARSQTRRDPEPRGLGAETRVRDQTYLVRLEQVGYLLDASGKAIDSFRTVTAMDLDEEGRREALRRGLLLTRTTRVKPGLYQVRLLVRDVESSLIGTASSFVEVPKVKGGRLALSSVFTDVRYLQAPATAAASQGGTLSQRRFPRGSEFGYRLLIYNARAAGAQARLTIKTRILRRGEVVRETPETPVEALAGSTPKRIATGGRIELGPLEPDEYTLELIVTDKLQRRPAHGVARQEIGFVVE